MRLEKSRTAPENTPNKTAKTWNSKPPELGSIYIVFSILDSNKQLVECSSTLYQRPLVRDTLVKILLTKRSSLQQGASYPAWGVAAQAVVSPLRNVQLGHNEDIYGAGQSPVGEQREFWT
jgi:hypothetical protein